LQLGASGAGKSTLTNRLAGAELQATRALGVDGRGQHTTTARALVVLPTGGVVLDTPGMRELRLWDADAGVDETFDDVAHLATRCRFRDCSHDTEPGCAVRAALEDGALDPERYGSYDKLRREAHAFAVRKDARAAADERRRHKTLARALRQRSRLG
jgi:ribosome biogenesis GTPase